MPLQVRDHPVVCCTPAALYLTETPRPEYHENLQITPSFSVYQLGIALKESLSMMVCQDPFILTNYANKQQLDDALKAGEQFVASIDKSAAATYHTLLDLSNKMTDVQYQRRPHPYQVFQVRDPL
jgi:hypothetical protein